MLGLRHALGIEPVIASLGERRRLPLRAALGQFGVLGYVFKKIGIPLAPLTLALVLGNRAEDAFRLSMIGAEGDLRVFWSNWLVGSITTTAIVLLFWPVIGALLTRARGLLRPADNKGAA